MHDLVDPEVHDAVTDSELRYAVRVTPTADARLVVIDNGKAKAKELLSYVAAELRSRMPIRSVEVYEKGQASRVLDDEEVRGIAARSDLAIAGVGDCGACSACSLADAIKLEQEGVPATVLITDVFLGNVAEFSRTIGLASYHSAVVAHPVSSKTAAQLRAYASSVADVVVRQLTGPMGEPASNGAVR